MMLEPIVTIEDLRRANREADRQDPYLWGHVSIIGSPVPCTTPDGNPDPDSGHVVIRRRGRFYLMYYQRVRYVNGYEMRHYLAYDPPYMHVQSARRAARRY